MDDSLDDFFAKKDKSSKKKGKKSKTKIVAADLLPASTPTPPNEPSDNVEQASEQLSEIRINDTPSETKEKKKTKKRKDGGDGSARHDVSQFLFHCCLLCIIIQDYLDMVQNPNGALPCAVHRNMAHNLPWSVNNMALILMIVFFQPKPLNSNNPC